MFSKTLWHIKIDWKLINYWAGRKKINQNPNGWSFKSFIKQKIKSKYSLVPAFSTMFVHYGSCDCLIWRCKRQNYQLSKIHDGGHTLLGTMSGSVCPLWERVKPRCNNSSSSSSQSSTHPAVSQTGSYLLCSCCRFWAEPWSRASTSHRGCSHLNIHGQTTAVPQHTSLNHPDHSPCCPAWSSKSRFSYGWHCPTVSAGGYRTTSIDSYRHYIYHIDYTEAVRVCVTVNWRCEAVSKV